MPEPAHDPIQPDDSELRHLPVHAPVVEARPIEPAPSPGGLQSFFASLPAPAVAAAGGFIMGVVTWVGVRVLRGGRRRSLRRGGRRGRRGVEIASSRSFLVDVHLLKDR